MAFEQTVKNLDNCLRTDKGCTSELDYVEQTSWILFLKYLDDLEKSKQIEAEIPAGTRISAYTAGDYTPRTISSPIENN